MSTTVIAVVVQILATALPWLGISVGSGDLSTTVQTLAVIFAGLWIWKERYGRGDISVSGFRK